MTWRRVVSVLRWAVVLLLGTLAVAGLIVLLVLVVASGLFEMRRNLEADQPWFSGFQASSLAVPIAALIAAGVAITTARWGLRAERERREVERRDTTERVLRDRFHDLVKLLAADELRAREGAAYAIAALADDWHAHYRNEPDKAHAEQQVCIDVLISQLRDPMPDDDAAYGHMAALKHSIQGIFRSRLGSIDGGTVQPGVWTSFNLVFDGCTFHYLDLKERVLSGQLVSFERAQFIGPAWFDGAHFTGYAQFRHACFGGVARFDRARFAGQSTFHKACFTGRSSFSGARFTRYVDFDGARFTGTAFFGRTRFVRSASFDGAHFMGNAMFYSARFSENASFSGTHFVRSAWFGYARFPGKASFSKTHFIGDVWFDGAGFTKDADFRDAHFVSPRVSLGKADLAGGAVWLGDTYFDVPPDDFPKCQECNALRSRQASASGPENESP